MHVGPRTHATTYQITRLDPNGHGKELYILYIYIYIYIYISLSTVVLNSRDW